METETQQEKTRQAILSEIFLKAPAKKHAMLRPQNFSSHRFKPPVTKQFIHPQHEAKLEQKQRLFGWVFSHEMSQGSFPREPSVLAMKVRTVFTQNDRLYNVSGIVF